MCAWSCSGSRKLPSRARGMRNRPYPVLKCSRSEPDCSPPSTRTGTKWNESITARSGTFAVRATFLASCQPAARAQSQQPARRPRRPPQRRASIAPRARRPRAPPACAASHAPDIQILRKPGQLAASTASATVPRAPQHQQPASTSPQRTLRATPAPLSLISTRCATRRAFLVLRGLGAAPQVQLTLLWFRCSCDSLMMRGIVLLGTLAGYTEAFWTPPHKPSDFVLAGFSSSWDFDDLTAPCHELDIPRTGCLFRVTPDMWTTGRMECPESGTRSSPGWHGL